MKFEIKTVTILMYAALAFALGSCTKKTITPAEDPQPAEVGFTASSQAVWVKGGETPTTSFPYDNFGVWGIARQEVDGFIYNLWGNNALAEVSKNDDTKLYEPTIAAYWVSGYAYNFLAVAPYDDEGFSSFDVTTKEEQTGVNNASDYMSFTYDISDKYNDDEYTFNLLGAAAETSVATGGYSDSQKLMFWHLFAQINIKVTLKDANGQVTGVVSKISLRNVDSMASYAIGGNEDELVVSVSPIVNNAQKEILFSGNLNEVTKTLHILPQNISDFKLYIDYTIGEGNAAVSFQDYEVNLNVDGNPSQYNFNGKYNWNITIGPKNAISFQVEVAPWGEVDVNDDAPIEII